ncbi:MAG TPA: Ku protein [Candidatus Angelobacter sp.]
MKKTKATQAATDAPAFAGSDKSPHQVWSGTLNFGLISMPIGLLSAATEERVSFNQLHDACKGRIKQQLFCPTCETVVQKSTLLKGYEYEKNEYVIVSEGELAKAEPKSAKILELSSFVPASQLDPIFFESSYYLVPGDGGQKPYALIRAAMRQSNLVGIARIVRSGKEHICVVRPYGQGMILHTLYWINEVRAVGFPTLPETSEAEIDMAAQLVEMLRADWDPTQYKDAYREAVLQLIANKREGREIVSTAVSEDSNPKVVDIASALKHSLELAKAKKGAA